MASTIKVDNVQNQPGTNIINKCSTTITIGASSDTVALASGASQTGFGASGAVSWNTTKITADPANAVSGTGYFCDTSGSGFTVTLPTGPSAGDIVGLADYNGNFASNNLTVARNGSNINGDASNFVIAQNNVSAQFIYVDGTEGWRIVFTGSVTGITNKFIVATGGTPCTGAVCGNYKVHTFTGPGTFTVCSIGGPTGSNTVDYVVAAGGGGGGSGSGNQGGGGGAGGFRESSGGASGNYTASPLGFSVSAAPVSATPYAITVGAGGAALVSPSWMPCAQGNPGSNSIFSTITSAGGGAGGPGGAPRSGLAGGSGGGGGGGAASSCGGAGNTPSENPIQGNNGGNVSPPHTPDIPSVGGGGAGAVGANSPSPPAVDGSGGGAGVTTSINFAATGFSGGGGGGAYTGSKGNDHSWPNGRAATPGVAACAVAGYGGGTGGSHTPIVAGADGSTNKGGGGGGSGQCATGGGGSGIVIIRYKFQ